MHKLTLTNLDEERHKISLESINIKEYIWAFFFSFFLFEKEVKGATSIATPFGCDHEDPSHGNNKNGSAIPHLYLKDSVSTRILDVRVKGPSLAPVKLPPLAYTSKFFNREIVDLYRHSRWKSSKNIPKPPSFAPWCHFCPNKDQVHANSTYDGTPRSTILAIEPPPPSLPSGYLCFSLQSNWIHLIQGSQAIVNWCLVIQRSNSSAWKHCCKWKESSTIVAIGAVGDELWSHHSSHGRCHLKEMEKRCDKPIQPIYTV